MKVYDNLSSLEKYFDIFIFDAYGVFYNGNTFYPGAREYMQKLVATGKTVVVLSNSSQKAISAATGYAQKGLLEGRDYHLFVTSGQVCYEDALNRHLPVSGNKYYLLGHKKEALSGSDFYRQVSTPDEADFVFISVPYLTPEEAEQAKIFQKDLLPAKADENGQILYYDSRIIDPFLPIVKQCVKQGLPAINANPDYLASEKHVGIEGVEYVVRNGLVAEYYRRVGGLVSEYGKPHQKVYDYVFNELKKREIVVNKTRAAMIGDTIRTDIKGAIKSGVAPVLCLETGVTAEEIKKGRNVRELLEQENVNCENIYLIRSVA